MPSRPTGWARSCRRPPGPLRPGGGAGAGRAPRARGGGAGRPRRYVATDRGHSLAPSDYDDLATSALRYLRATAGEGAVRAFAEQRVGELERRYRPVLEAAGDDPERRTQALAGALTTDGYAATVRGDAPMRGRQLCQGHCPVQHVAREFPELCEAETDAFSRLLGVHVQRLATLAHGDHVCTTHVPPLSLNTSDGRQSE